MRDDHHQRVVLSADDDEDAQILLSRAFSKTNADILLKTVKDGNEAIHYLAGEGPFSDRARFPLPHLLLLDLKMPLVSGFEVLEYIHQHRELQTFPTIAFSSSDNEKDIRQAVTLGCHFYVVKPTEFSKLVEFISALEAEFLIVDPRPSTGSQEGPTPFSHTAIQGKQRPLSPN